jgi:protease PrsW
MVSTILLVILGLLPSVIWLLFYLREDSKRPEPKKLIIFAFIVGGVSTFFALAFQLFYNNIAVTQGIALYSITSLVVLAGIEELVKYGAVYFSVSRRKEFDEPIDPMIYMIVAALGFAAVENIATIFQANSSLETAALRFVGATLLHSLSSGLVGYYWGRFLATKRNFKSLILTGLALATILHVIFNYLIITTGPAGVVIIFLIFIALFILKDFEKLKSINQ